MKKRIIFVAQALWLGGIETALVNLLNHLDYDKYDITCLITEDYQDMAPAITSRCRLLVADRSHTVSFREPYRYRRLYTLMEEPQRASFVRRAVWKLLCISLRALEARLYSSYIREQLQEEHFDTAVIYSDRMAELTVRAIRADRYLMFYHNADLGRAYHDEYGYRASQKIIAVSDAQCEKLKAVRPRYASKMTAIPNYIDVETTRQKASQLPEEQLFPHEGIHLVSCGRLAHQKGFDIAVESCAALVKSDFPNLHWYILGQGPKREELVQKIREYGMEDHFHLLGTRKNPFPYMKQADLYVQPSRTEGYSLSILEARVLACPTAATYGAAGEQLEDGVTGTLCETTAEAIAAAVRRHLEDPEYSAACVRNMEAFSFEKVNEEILAKIEALL